MNIYNHVRKLNKQKGFTLVEMMVATFLFSLAVTGLMYMSSKGLNASKNAQDQVIGGYLALEAIEAVRNYRDSAFIQGDSTWDDIFTGAVDDDCIDSSIGVTGDSCQLTYAQGSNIKLEACNIVGGVVCPVYKNGSIYEQEGSPGTPLTHFRRSIRFTKKSDEEMAVTVVVAWPRGLTEYTTHLFLWSNI